MRKIAAKDNYEGLDIYSDLLDIAIGHSESEEVDHLTSLREIEKYLKTLIYEADGSMEEDARKERIGNANLHLHGTWKSPYPEENSHIMTEEEIRQELERINLSGSDAGESWEPARSGLTEIIEHLTEDANRRAKS